MPMDEFDRYRGRIAVKGRTGWRWCFRQPDYETVVQKDAPNRHRRIQRIDGKPIAFERGILQTGALLTNGEMRTIDTVKHGLANEDQDSAGVRRLNRYLKRNMELAHDRSKD